VAQAAHRPGEIPHRPGAREGRMTQRHARRLLHLDLVRHEHDCSRRACSAPAPAPPAAPPGSGYPRPPPHTHLAPRGPHARHAQLRPPRRHWSEGARPLGRTKQSDESVGLDESFGHQSPACSRCCPGARRRSSRLHQSQRGSQALCGCRPARTAAFQHGRVTCNASRRTDLSRRRTIHH